MFAGTFHAFCCKVLRQDGHHLGIDPKFVIYDSKVLARVCVINTRTTVLEDIPGKIGIPNPVGIKSAIFKVKNEAILNYYIVNISTRKNT